MPIPFVVIQGNGHRCERKFLTDAGKVNIIHKHVNPAVYIIKTNLQAIAAFAAGKRKGQEEGVCHGQGI